MSEISYEMLLENLFDGVYYVDLNKKISIWNKGAERITGYSKAEVLGKSCFQNILRHIDEEGRELCMGGCPLSETMRDGKVREANVYLHHKQGHRLPVSVRISPVRDNDGNIIGGVEIFTDNSNALQILVELENAKKEAYQDALTTIGNRRYGEITLNSRISEWDSQNVSFGVVFLDIDHFKRFNDVYGHKIGDDVLVMVSKTIANLLRRSDTIARWGGEEFVVVFSDISAAVFNKLAERIRIFIERSFINVGDDQLNVTVSLGATLVQPGDTPETIIRRADALMYKSKASGRNKVTMG
jgi:diguanylate cyclase (GGDEF)-like protein/PAS domain S-box-containing protein